MKGDFVNFINKKKVKLEEKKKKPIKEKKEKTEEVDNNDFVTLPLNENNQNNGGLKSLFSKLKNKEFGEIDEDLRKKNKKKAREDSDSEDENNTPKNQNYNKNNKNKVSKETQLISNLLEEPKTSNKHKKETPNNNLKQKEEKANANKEKSKNKLVSNQNVTKNANVVSKFKQNIYGKVSADNLDNIYNSLKSAITSQIENDNTDNKQSDNNNNNTHHIIYQIRRFKEDTTREDLYKFFEGILGKNNLIKVKLLKDNEKKFNGVVLIEILNTPTVKNSLLGKKLNYDNNRLKIKEYEINN